MNHKVGRLTPNGVLLEKHEYATILFLTNLGYDIELIPPLNHPKIRTPDFIMLNKAWEMKSPQGNSKFTIEHAFKRAARQSENVILDLRRMQLETKVALDYISKLFSSSRRVRHLLVITKEKKFLTFNPPLTTIKTIEGDLSSKCERPALFFINLYMIPCEFPPNLAKIRTNTLPQSQCETFRSPNPPKVSHLLCYNLIYGKPSQNTGLTQQETSQAN